MFFFLNITFSIDQHKNKLHIIKNKNSLVIFLSLPIYWSVVDHIDQLLTFFFSSANTRFFFVFFIQFEATKWPLKKDFIFESVFVNEIFYSFNYLKLQMNNNNNFMCEPSKNNKKIIFESF